MAVDQSETGRRPCPGSDCDMMHTLPLTRPGERLSVLCLGAHSDDIEIGAGGSLLSLVEAGVKLDVTWCVLSAEDERGHEARSSALAFMAGANSCDIKLGTFKDSFFPYHGEAIKKYLDDIRRLRAYDLVLTHRRDDAHQDHREVCALTWNAFRDHLILEYEIPKWDGDLGQPNTYVPLPQKVIETKIALLMQHFGSQRSKDWFEPDTFRGLARLRGLECRAPGRFAEAFWMRKVRIDLTTRSGDSTSQRLNLD